MKVKVGKQTKRTFQYYKINFRFAQPFKVIIDGSFIKFCSEKKQDLKEKIEKITGGRTYISSFVYS
jgi:rRNA-processing protein FCF1